MPWHAATILLSAFLLFLVQPLIGKYILPWFGGGAGVWSACLVFFQVMLLAGYAYAHAINRLASPRKQAIVHCLVMIAGLLFLPVIPDGDVWKPGPDVEPVTGIVVLLLACIGGPYLALSATGPLVQSWFARSFPGRSPYRLYALSNTGSLLALLAYPTVIEPMLSRQAQAVAWSWGFVLYVILCAACAVMAFQGAAPARGPIMNPARRKPGKSLPTDEPSSMFHRAMWITLPACASVLLLSLTARLSEQIAPVPLLWVIPLAVYLLTFIVAFEWPRLYHRGVILAGMVVVCGVTAMLMCGRGWTLGWHVAAAIITMFIAGLACHGEVHRLRPPAHRLTAFYLAIAFGGAMGAIFVAIVAPLIFNFNVEFEIALFGAYALVLASFIRDRPSAFHRGARRLQWVSMTGLAAIALAVIVERHVDRAHGLLMRSRNFYGVLTLRQTFDSEHQPQCLAILHGPVVHGLQLIDPAYRNLPTTYYGPNSGVGIIMRRFRADGSLPRRIGLVGLGAGTLAAFGRPNDELLFYEIDPRVTELARNQFWFIKDSPARIAVVHGDARLTMERQPPQHFDILVLDAFNGDAVPVHLLTTEAFAIYRKHISDDGAILVNASNSFLHLDRVLVRLARELHSEVRMFHDQDDPYTGVTSSVWVLLTNNRELLNDQEVRKSGFPPAPDTRVVRLWTDDHTSLLEILGR